MDFSPTGHLFVTLKTVLGFATPFSQRVVSKIGGRRPTRGTIRKEERGALGKWSKRHSRLPRIQKCCNRSHLATRFQGISGGCHSTIGATRSLQPALSLVDIPKPPLDASLPSSIVSQSRRPSSCWLRSWDPSIRVWILEVSLFDNLRDRARSSRAQKSLICGDVRQCPVFQVCSMHAHDISYPETIGNDAQAFQGLCSYYVPPP